MVKMRARRPSSIGRDSIADFIKHGPAGRDELLGRLPVPELRRCRAIPQLSAKIDSGFRSNAADVWRTCYLDWFKRFYGDGDPVTPDEFLGRIRDLLGLVTKVSSTYVVLSGKKTAYREFVVVTQTSFGDDGGYMHDKSLNSVLSQQPSSFAPVSQRSVVTVDSGQAQSLVFDHRSYLEYEAKRKYYAIRFSTTPALCAKIMSEVNYMCENGSDRIRVTTAKWSYSGGRWVQRRLPKGEVIMEFFLDRDRYWADALACVDSDIRIRFMAHMRKVNAEAGRHMDVRREKSLEKDYFGPHCLISYAVSVLEPVRDSSRQIVMWHEYCVHNCGRDVRSADGFMPFNDQWCGSHLYDVMGSQEFMESLAKSYAKCVSDGSQPRYTSAYAKLVDVPYVEITLMPNDYRNYGNTRYGEIATGDVIDVDDVYSDTFLAHEDNASLQVRFRGGDRRDRLGTDGLYVL